MSFGGVNRNMRNYPLIGAVTLSTLMGCSLNRNPGKAERTRTVEQAYAFNSVDRFIPHISTDRANKGDSVNGFCESGSHPLAPP